MPWESPPVHGNQDDQAGRDGMDTAEAGESPIDDDILGVLEGIAMMEAMYQAEEASIQKD